MPMRIMGYDYSSYKKQYDSNAKKYQSSEGLDEDEFLLDRNRPMNETKDMVTDYAREHDVNKSVVMTVAGAANCKLDYNAFEKRDGGMCTLFEEIAKENEAKGIVETGYEFGASEADILKRLQQKLEISLQMAQEFLNMFGKQTV